MAVLIHSVTQTWLQVIEGNYFSKKNICHNCIEIDLKAETFFLGSDN